MPFLVAVPIGNLHTPDLNSRGLLPRTDALTPRRRRPLVSAYALRATMAPPTGLSDSSRATQYLATPRYAYGEVLPGPSWPGDKKRASGFVRNLLAMSLVDPENPIRATRQEKELYKTNEYIYQLACSPDGEQLAFLAGSKAVYPNVVKTIPATGGEPRTLHTLEEGRYSWGVGLSWTPDGHHVVVGRPNAPDMTDELWSIPVAGGELSKLDLGVRVRQLSLHPDGWQIAVTRSERNGGWQIWALENFLP